MRPRRRVALSMPRLSAFSWKRLSVFDFLSQSKTREQAPPRSTMRRRPGDLREDGMADSQAQAIVAIDQGTTSSRAIAFRADGRSEEHTSELQSLMRISYAVFCLKKKNIINNPNMIKQYIPNAIDNFQSHKANKNIS